MKRNRKDFEEADKIKKAMVKKYQDDKATYWKEAQEAKRSVERKHKRKVESRAASGKRTGGK